MARDITDPLGLVPVTHKSPESRGWAGRIQLTWKKNSLPNAPFPVHKKFSEISDVPPSTCSAAPAPAGIRAESAEKGNKSGIVSQGSNSLRGSSQVKPGVRPGRGWGFIVPS